MMESAVTSSVGGSECGQHDAGLCTNESSSNENQLKPMIRSNAENISIVDDVIYDALSSSYRLPVTSTEIKGVASEVQSLEEAMISKTENTQSHLISDEHDTDQDTVSDLDMDLCSAKSPAHDRENSFSEATETASNTRDSFIDIADEAVDTDMIFHNSPSPYHLSNDDDSSKFEHLKPNVFGINASEIEFDVSSNSCSARGDGDVEDCITSDTTTGKASSLVKSFALTKFSLVSKASDILSEIKPCEESNLVKATDTLSTDSMQGGDDAVRSSSVIQRDESNNSSEQISNVPNLETGTVNELVDKSHVDSEEMDKTDNNVHNEYDREKKRKADSKLGKADSNVCDEHKQLRESNTGNNQIDTVHNDDVGINKQGKSDTAQVKISNGDNDGQNVESDNIQIDNVDNNVTDEQQKTEKENVSKENKASGIKIGIRELRNIGGVNLVLDDEDNTELVCRRSRRERFGKKETGIDRITSSWMETHDLKDVVIELCDVNKSILDGALSLNLKKNIVKKLSKCFYKTKFSTPKVADNSRKYSLRSEMDRTKDKVSESNYIKSQSSNGILPKRKRRKGLVRVAKHFDMHGPKDVKRMEHIKVNTDELFPMVNTNGDCTICKVRFISSDHSKEHDMDGPFYCTYCCVKFKTQQIRNMHILIHEEPEELPNLSKCFLCKEKGLFRGQNSLERLVIHMENFHKDGNKKHGFKCSACLAEFDDGRMFVLHLQLHKPLYTDCECKVKICYACNDLPVRAFDVRLFQPTKPCNECLFRYSDLSEHEKVHQVSYGVKHYNCQFCKVVFRDEKLALLHAQFHSKLHPKLPDYIKCSLCSHNESICGIFEHVCLYHFQVPGQLYCVYCGLKVQEKTLLAIHMKSHWPLAPLPTSKPSVKQTVSIVNNPCTDSKQKVVISKKANNTEMENTDKSSSNSVSVRQPDETLMQLSCTENPDAAPQDKSSSREKQACQICSLLFLDLKTHKSKEHGLQSNFRCPVCKATFVSKGAAELHSYVHSGKIFEVKNVCSICKLNVRNLELHVTTCHNQTPQRTTLKCILCDLQFFEANFLRLHTRGHLPGPSQTETQISRKDYASQYEDILTTANAKKILKANENECYKCFLRVSDLGYHMTEHLASKARFRCKVCKVTFYTEVVSSTHALIHCNWSPSIAPICNICPDRKTFFNRENFFLHGFLAHKDMMHPSRVIAVKCGVCHATLPDETYYNVHKSYHYAKWCNCSAKECKFCRCYTCFKCGEFYNTKSEPQYKQHGLSCTGSKSQVVKIARVEPYQRIVNPSEKSQGVKRSKFSDSLNARPNERANTKENSKQNPMDLEETCGDEDDTGGNEEDSTECMSCRRRIPSGTVADHMRKYHSAKLFSCNRKGCSFTAKNVGLLKSHRITHLKSDIFRCLFCSKYFPEPRQLFKHNYMNHYETHHRCNVCAEFFTDIELLQCHNRMFEWDPPKPFPCDYCCASFSFCKSLEKHREKHLDTIRSCLCNEVSCRTCYKFRCTCGSVFKVNQFVNYMLHMRECYKCYKCNHNSSSLKSLQAHEVSHYVKCRVCNALAEDRKTLAIHMTNHDCHCSNDDLNCLFCKKAWCSSCSKRFLRKELAMFLNHQKNCPNSKLMCVCCEKNCLICQKGKCSECQRKFKSVQFNAFFIHVSSCIRESPDPFAPLNKLMKVKSEPANDEDSKKQKRTDHGMIELGSESEGSLRSDEEDDVVELKRDSNKKNLCITTSAARSSSISAANVEYSSVSLTVTNAQRIDLRKLDHDSDSDNFETVTTIPPDNQERCESELNIYGQQETPTEANSLLDILPRPIVDIRNIIAEDNANSNSAGVIDISPDIPTTPRPIAVFNIQLQQQQQQCDYSAGPLRIPQIINICPDEDMDNYPFASEPYHSGEAQEQNAHEGF